MTRHNRLEKDHLRLLDHRLDHLHGGAEPPGFEGRRIVPRLQKKKDFFFFKIMLLNHLTAETRIASFLMISCQ